MRIRSPQTLNTVLAGSSAPWATGGYDATIDATLAAILSHPLVIDHPSALSYHPAIWKRAIAALLDHAGCAGNALIGLPVLELAQHWRDLSSSVDDADVAQLALDLGAAFEPHTASHAQPLAGCAPAMQSRCRFATTIANEIRVMLLACAYARNIHWRKSLVQ